MDILRTLMRMLGVSNREVERRLELNTSTLSRVFGGIVEAKLELVLSIARAIGLEYVEFFAFAYPELPETPSESARRLLSMLEGLHPGRLARLAGTAPAPEPRPRVEKAAEAPKVDRDTLVRDMREALREIFEEMDRKKGGDDSGPKSGNGGD
jgi:transcriptional regulator with XRE-family HTH domain